MQIFIFIILFAIDITNYRNPPSIGGQSFASDTTCDTVLPHDNGLDNGLDTIDEEAISRLEADLMTPHVNTNTANGASTKCQRRGTKRKYRTRTQPYKSATPAPERQMYFESESMYYLIIIKLIINFDKYLLLN